MDRDCTTCAAPACIGCVNGSSHKPDHAADNVDATIAYKGSTDGEHWFGIDPAAVAGSWEGLTMPHREEPDMLTTYAYEVLVAEKRDEKGTVTRVADIVDRQEGLLLKPTREGLLVQYAEELAGRGIENFENEVVVNIRPFCG